MLHFVLLSCQLVFYVKPCLVELSFSIEAIISDAIPASKDENYLYLW